jgi:hypothetical protein
MSTELKSLILAVACGAIGIALLRLFYRAVRLEWPSNYVTMTRSFGLIVNRSVQRYLLFVLLPVYLVSLLMSTITAREKASGWAVALIIGIGFGITNHAYPVFKALLRSWRNFRGPDGLLRIGLTLLSIGAALLGGFGPGPFDFVIPPIDEFFKAVWTTIFVVVIGKVALDLTRHETRVGNLFDIAEKEADVGLVKYAIEKANEASADPDLVVAILYAENLQRPAWFRQLEYLKGRIFPRGSYGVMQVTTDRPISDTGSIDLAIDRHLRGVVIPMSNEHGQPDEVALRTVLRKYNNNPAFVDLAAGLYERMKRGY